MSNWEQWIAGALAEEQDDAFVRLLRGHVGSGSRVLRVSLVAAEDDRLPSYLVVLAHGHELTQMHVPHSASFTRWCFETGTRVENPDEEEARFTLLVRERLQPLQHEVGEGYFASVLLERLRILGPPRTVTLLENQHEYFASTTASKMRLVGEINACLRDLAGALIRQLQYSEQQAASILDGALEQYVDALFHVRERRELWDR